MPKIHQLIAIVKETLAKAEEVYSSTLATFNRADMFSGHMKTYQPKEEEGDVLPSDSKKMHLTVGDALGGLEKRWSELFDLTITQETGNQQAKGDIVIDGKTILANVPVAALLHLAKRLVSLRKLVEKVPTLDPVHNWKMNDTLGYYETESIRTARNKKMPRAFVKYEATKEHPAQVEVFSEDVLEGYWTTIHHSGAWSITEKRDVLDRIDELIKAVKFAREEANTTTVNKIEAGKPIFDYALRGILQ